MSKGVSIGTQVGYWEMIRKEKEQKQAEWEERQTLADQFVRRVAACRSLPALDKVAAEAREQKIWRKEVVGAVQRCNQRLRGGNDMPPAVYSNGRRQVVVKNDRVIGVMVAGRCAYHAANNLTARVLAESGYRYAGSLKE